jgi:TBC1 domain family member 15
MTIELDSTLAQAEVLFLTFAQLVGDLDRRKAEEVHDRDEGLRRRGVGAQRTGPGLPELSPHLRELLAAGRSELAARRENDSHV